ncbi:MAG TPA: hypothetical protein VKB50_13990, partial [Vicinamibacterales bacterium]|nr:hypothetical protein [Vicinamibacterales bacterium]
MAEKHGERWGAVCAGLIAAVLALTAATRGAQQKQEFDEITVHRINIVEPDGTLRMVMANRARFPGVIVRGKEAAADRPYAGLLFYNNEGTENGGLIFGGRRDPDGRIVDSGVSLSMDKYGVGGQMVQLAGVSDNANRFAGLRVKDNSIGGPNTNRIWVGNGDDGAATVALMDGQGRRRIVMEVASDGASKIVFLDASG